MPESGRERKLLRKRNLVDVFIIEMNASVGGRRKLSDYVNEQECKGVKKEGRSLGKVNFTLRISESDVRQSSLNV